MAETISWIATAATILAAMMTASNLGSRVTGYGFAVFFAGSLAWLATGLLTAQPALMWTNAVLAFLNLFGVWRWLGRQARIEHGAEIAQASSERTPGEALFPAAMLTRALAVDRSGEPIGHCVDAMVGCRSGCVDYVVVSSGGVAGVGERMVRLDWGQARVDGDRLAVALSRSSFDLLPDLPRDRWPG